MKDFCTEMCENHMDEVIEYFCNEHKCFGCSSCITSEHRTCEKIDYIPEVATAFVESEEIIDLQRCLTDLMCTNERQKREIRRQSKAVSIQAERAKFQVKILRSKVDSILDDLEKKIDNTIDAIKNGDENKMEKLSEETNEISKDLQRHIADIDHRLDTQAMCQLFVATKRVHESVNGLSRKIIAIHDSISIERYQFTPSAIITELIAKIKDIGTLEARDRRAKVPKFETDINVRENNDKEECEITGMTLVSEQMLVVADNSNHSVKLIDTIKGEIKAIHKLEGTSVITRPFDVAKIDNTRVAVTYPYRRTIRLLEISAGFNQLKVDGEIDATGECTGIDCAGKNLIISFRKPPVVKILTLTGKIIRTIRGKFTEFPDYVAVNQNKKLVYISNWASPGPGSVMCMTTEGKPKVVLKDDKLYGPHGVSIGKHGVLYVCGRFLHNVLQLSDECTMIQELVNKDDGVKMPRCITESEQNDRLYIGIDSDNIKVFQLY